MIKNYLTVAIHNLLRNKMHSTLNRAETRAFFEPQRLQFVPFKPYA